MLKYSTEKIPYNMRISNCDASNAKKRFHFHMEQDIKAKQKTKGQLEQTKEEFGRRPK